MKSFKDRIIPILIYIIRHYMKTHVARGFTAPLFLTSALYAVERSGSRPCLFNPWDSLRYPFGIRLDGLQSRCGRCREDKLSYRWRHSTRNLVAMPTEQSRFRTSYVFKKWVPGGNLLLGSKFLKGLTSSWVCDLYEIWVTGYSVRWGLF
jgi:hypothetical protein